MENHAIIKLILVLILTNACSSIERRNQKMIYEITDYHFNTMIKQSKKDFVWINNKIDIEFALSQFDTVKFFKRPQIEIDFNRDSILKSEILTPENIKYFKEQLNSHDYDFISENIKKSSSIKIIPPDAIEGFYLSHSEEEIQLIKSILITKDSQYALVYYVKANFYSGLQIYKKLDGVWIPFRGLAGAIS